MFSVNCINFVRLYTAADAAEVLAMEAIDHRAEGQGGRALLMDIPPTEGALALVTALVDQGWKVDIRDHHLPMGSSPRDLEIKALSAKIGEVIGAPADYRKHREDYPGCSALVPNRNVLVDYDLILADADPDGLTCAMKALGLGYVEIDQDGGVLDGAPEGRSASTLSQFGWLLARVWASAPSVNHRDPASVKAHEDWTREFFLHAIENRKGWRNDDYRIDHSTSVLEEMAKPYAAKVEAAYAVANKAQPITSLPGWFLVDLRGIDADRGTFAPLVEAMGATVIVSILDSGIIAANHGGVQYSAARTKAGEVAGVNLATFKPEGMESSPKSGVISNTPFLIHMSEEVFKQITAA